MVGFVVDGNSIYAGKHLLIDLYNCQHAPLATEVESAMVAACIATGATVLFNHSHAFEGDGSSGVCVLAESHGTWHFWPENHFCAVDIFVCGACDPMLAVPILARCFQTQNFTVKLEKRGLQNTKGLQD